MKLSSSLQRIGFLEFPTVDQQTLKHLHRANIAQGVEEEAAKKMVIEMLQELFFFEK